MYIDSCKVRSGNKVYLRVLLRESYREHGKVKHRTIANLSKCSEAEIAAIKLALQHKQELSTLQERVMAEPRIEVHQGLSVGAVAVVQGVAKELGILDALGNDRQGKLALWQVIARVIDQGSRLSAVRLAQTHACCDLLGLDAFNEDDLYSNLDWITGHQCEIEERLFESLHPQKKAALFLYDVTSSYLEGTHNQLGAFGYNRDGKRGKMQIVIGLLCDQDGVPLSIEVFAGNTNDPKTVASQIEKAAARFGGGEVTFVGDRGMLKSAQIEELTGQGFHYITAITKPQIETLLKNGVFEMELFDQPLAEVCEEQTRYVLRRNPRRAQEMEASRNGKLGCLKRKIETANAYLATHGRAKFETALKKLRGDAIKLKLQRWVELKLSGARSIELEINEPARMEEAKLDGCYVLKTDLAPAQASKEVVHARYKDLTLVEHAFRTSKTVELELRPIHVRLETSTRGHALVVMLAYRVVQTLAERWGELDLTVQEGLRALDTLCAIEVQVDGKPGCHTLPQPSPDVARLIELARVSLPKVFRNSGVKVATKKKLQNSRSRH